MALPLPYRADARANRQRIIAAARDVFAERGVEADIREICARSGVGMGTLYRNFPTKDDLIVAILRTIAEEATETIAAAEAEPDPGLAFLAMLRGMWEVVERHRQLASAMHAYAHDMDVPEFTALKERGRRVVERAHRSGGFGQAVSAEFLFDFVEQQMDTYLALRERWDEATVRAFCEQLLTRGIVAGSAPA